MLVPDVHQGGAAFMVGETSSRAAIVDAAGTLLVLSSMVLGDQRRLRAAYIWVGGRLCCPTWQRQYLPEFHSWTEYQKLRFRNIIAPTAPKMHGSEFWLDEMQALLVLLNEK
jgi:hypothetical protein